MFTCRCGLTWTRLLPISVPYPCGFWPLTFSGYEFEVHHNGQTLTRVPPPPAPATGVGASAEQCTGSAFGRLPLHLYRFEEPGTHSIRFTAAKNGDTLYQSDWTDIEIEPFSEEKRNE